MGGVGGVGPKYPKLMKNVKNSVLRVSQAGFLLAGPQKMGGVGGGRGFGGSKIGGFRGGGGRKPGFGVENRGLGVENRVQDGFNEF